MGQKFPQAAWLKKCHQHIITLKNANIALVQERTTVLPLFILWMSLWGWAQKSRQAVTPEKGRPSLVPSRHSRATCSFSTWNRNVRYVALKSRHNIPELINKQKHKLTFITTEGDAQHMGEGVWKVELSDIVQPCAMRSPLSNARSSSWVQLGQVWPKNWGSKKTSVPVTQPGLLYTARRKGSELKCLQMAGIYLPFVLMN